MAKVRLGDIATVVTKGTTPTTMGFQFEDGGINFVKIESISEDGTLLKEKFSHISDECNVQMRRSQLQENDILFSIAGAIGRSAIVTKEILPANTNQALAIIRVPRGKIDYNYLLYALSSSAINQQATQHQQGVAQLNISLKNVSDFLLPIYTEARQKQIVHNLKKIDKLISLRKQQLAKLDELVKARFVEMFGEPSSNPMGWLQTTVGAECYYIKDGPHKSLTDVGMGNGYPFISVRNIVNGYIDFSTAKYISEADYKDAIKKCCPEKGDILYSKGGTTGIAKLVDIDIKFANWVHLAVLKFNHNEFNGSFFEKMLNCDYCYKQSQMLTKGIANRDLVLSAMAQIKIYKPPILLQNQFATFVERVDQQKQTVQQSLDKLELMKKALMQEYFG